MYAPPCSWRTGTKSTEDRASDSFRSSVSSPGIPKTCLTPSASRHSTKTSDARRLATDGRAYTLMSGMGSPTSYVKSGDYNIAYSSHGEAPLDLMYVPTWVGQIEVIAEEPTIMAFSERINRF